MLSRYFALYRFTDVMKRTSLIVQMKVLGALENTPGKSMKERYKKVAKMTFTDELGHQRQFTWRTIQTWWYWYRQNGLITPQPRSDKGFPRKTRPEQLLEAIEKALPLFRPCDDINIEAIYRACIEKGYLHRKQIAPNTFRRHVNDFDLLKGFDELKDESVKKARLAFAKAHANELWQVDTLHGPMLLLDGKKTKTYLIAFIDDASRVITHGQFYTQDSTTYLIDCFRKALFKRGVPRAVYADNGANYSSKEFALTCVRIGALLSHAPVRDGAAKGKIERFFRTVRDQFLVRDLSAVKSLEDLNKQFLDWVENDYHQHKHGTIGMKPYDRFALDAGRIQYLASNPYSNEIFYLETTRGVLADNTFSFANLRFEAPRDLRNKKITIRYDRLSKNEAIVIVYEGSERIGEADLVDLIANDRKPLN
jgi:putative transposase